MVFQEQLEAMLRDRGEHVPPAYWRVLWCLFSKLRYGNSVELYVGEVGGLAGLNRATAGKALALWEDLDVIRRQAPVGGRPATILMSPRVVFKGTIEARAKALRQWEESPRWLKT